MSAQTVAAAAAGTFVILIEKGEIAGGGGRVTASGALKMQWSSQTTGRPMKFTGSLKETRGEGTLYTEGGRCQGTFSVVRQ